MDLTSIFTIGGKPGLQKLVAKSPNGVIVESLIDGKRFNAYSSYKISSLEDISIYCENEDVPLSDVLCKIAEKNEFKERFNSSLRSITFIVLKTFFIM